MDLFEYAQKNDIKSQPLANRMRPKNLGEYIGQDHIIGPNKLLRRAIEADQISSLIFYGPPGSGKTALANVIATQTSSEFIKLNAVISGVQELREIIKEAKSRLAMYQKRTIVFIDEIHRFNKAQQDALLPYVEDGTIILIGATTENPYFEVNSALLSRARLFKFNTLSAIDVAKVIKQALLDQERGLGNLPIKITEEALQHLIKNANGDARNALNALELAALTTPINEDGQMVINLEVAEESIQRKAIQYDKKGTQHYDVISAFIKSVRGSNPDASIHYLVRMLEAGEDPRFIARRMIILAAEDIGLADPQALGIAVSAFQALEFVGLPEARIPLAEACIYLATAPKSNTAYLALNKATADLTSEIGDVPIHLRDSHNKLPEEKKGNAYLYPHDFENNYVEQQYLPDALQGKVYYNPTDNGAEEKIKSRMANLTD